MLGFPCCFFFLKQQQKLSRHTCGSYSRKTYNCGYIPFDFQQKLEKMFLARVGITYVKNTSVRTNVTKNDQKG